MDVMELMAKTIEENFALAILAVTVFSIGLALVEFIWEWRTERLTREYFKEMGASLSVAIPSILLMGFFAYLFAVLYFSTYFRITWKIPVNWGTFFLLLVLVDFIHYWGHRFEHKIRFLWGFHSIHHSSPIYNYSTALRVVFFRTFFDIAYYFVLVLIGFHPLLVFVCLEMVDMYQFWLHTRLIGKLGFLEWFMNTPSHHRVHHGSQEKYLDKNYSGIFIVWDRLFGTFQEEEETPIFGLTKPIYTVNPLKVHFHEYINIFRDLRRAKGFRGFAEVLLGPPRR